MRATPILLTLGLLGVTACVDSGKGERNADSTATPMSIELPTPAPFTTSVLTRALPEPVPVPGESLVFEERFSAQNSAAGEIWISLSDDFDRRNDLILCAWRDDSGWAACSSVGAGGSGTPVAIPAGNDPIEIYLLLEHSEPGPLRPLRRLSRIDDVDVPSSMALRNDYPTVADVLTMQPGSDGNYLEVSP